MESQAPRMMPAPVFVAIDGGATKTEGVLFTPEGDVLARMVCGPSNPNGSAQAIADTFTAVIRGLGLAGERRVQLAAVGACVAGGSNEKVQQLVRSIFAQQLPRVQRVCVASDTLAALYSGVDAQGGLALIAGSGSVVFGLSPQGETFRVGGWGHLISDEGSGYALGNGALCAVFAAFDGIGAQTQLTQSLLEQWGVREVPELIPLLYSEGKAKVAALAPLVLEAALAGDAVARGVVTAAATALASLLASGVAQGRERYRMAAPLRVVKTGGLWRSAFWQAAFAKAWRGQADAEAVAFIEPQLPPVWGAARYLLQQCGVRQATGAAERFAASYSGATSAITSDSTSAAAKATASGVMPTASGAKAVAPEAMPATSEAMPAASETMPTAEPSASLEEAAALDTLATEAAAADGQELDTLPVNVLVRKLIAANSEAVAAALEQVEPIADVVTLVADRLKHGGRLFYVGAGTSGRLGILDAAECPPTFGVAAQMVQGLIAGGPSAIQHPAEGAEDDAAQAEPDLRSRQLCAADVVIALAASGRTPYCIGALRYARSLGAATVALSCNSPAVMSAEADHVIELQTGPEVLAGSTRLKAGSAQKIVLNAISTAVMVRLGRVYGNRMVDMVASNEKLRLRAQHMVAALAAVDTEQAAALLREAGGSIKVAIVMAGCQLSAEEAEALLEQSDGFVRAALATGTARSGA